MTLENMKIRIVSPAKAIDQAKIDFAVKYLRSFEFSVEVSEHAAGQFNYFSGTDEERLSDFQQALDDDSVDVILCSRGGYGCIRILDRLDWSAFERSPKLICGYSDVTVFHNYITAVLGKESMHSTAPLNFGENTSDSLESLVNVLNGQENKYVIDGHRLNREGTVKALVVGGNLAIIYSLIGTDADINTEGKILIIEDIGEAIYSVDRMMWSLKKSGKLDKLVGLIVGGMTNMKDSEVPFGQSVEQVIAEAVSEYDFPLCFNFPFGHIEDNRAVILGRSATLTVGDKVEFSQ